MLDPDGATLYAPGFHKKVPTNGRRLFAKPTASAAAVAADGSGAKEAQAVDGAEEAAVPMDVA